MIFFSLCSLSRAARAEPTCSIPCEYTYFHNISILALLNVQPMLFIEYIVNFNYECVLWPAGRIWCSVSTISSQPYLQKLGCELIIQFALVNFAMPLL